MSDDDDWGGFDDEISFDDAPTEVSAKAEPADEVVKTETVVSNDEPDVSLDDLVDEDNSPEKVEEKVPEVPVEKAEKAEEKAPEAPIEKSKPKPKKNEGKKAFKPLSKKEKSLRKMLRRAGLDEEGGLPPIEELLAGKQGKKVKISDIAIFISDVEDDVLSEFAKKCPHRNRVNLSAEVELAQIESVGAKILGSGRMYQPIQVANISDGGALECTSGRHRLIFLAMAYGVDESVPVYIEDMTLNEARDAVVYANQGRKTKALEQAEHAVLQAIGGNIEAEQDEIYLKTITNKTTVKKYCVYSVFERGLPLKFAFPVSMTSSRKGGGLTTLKALEAYWGSALEWNKGMERIEFDGKLKQSIEFLNALVEAFQKDGAFESDQHMATMTLSAIGKYYRERQSMVGDSMSLVGNVATSIIAMGEIGRQKHEVTYEALASMMK